MKKIFGYLSILLIFLVSCDDNLTNENADLELVSKISLDKPIESLLLSNNVELQEFNSGLLIRTADLVESLRVKEKDVIALEACYTEKTAIPFEKFFPEYSKKKSCNEKVVLKGLEYEIGIRFHNVNTADIEKSPIVCVGTEICNSEVLYEDKIVGWLVNGERTTEVLVTKEYADTTSHPIFIVVNGTNDLDIDEIDAAQSTKKSAATVNSGYKLEIVDEKIDVNYDKHGKQEYNVSWVFDEPTYDGWGPYDRKHILDIDNSDWSLQETVFSFYEHHEPQSDDVSSWNNCVRLLVGATYEHDWYASLKEIVVYEGFFGNDYTVEIRASGADEYYQTFVFEIGTTATPWYSFNETVINKGSVQIKSSQE